MAQADASPLNLLRDSFRERSLKEYIDFSQSAQNVSGTSLPAAKSIDSRGNTALPVSVENEPLQKLALATELLSKVTGIVFENLSRYPSINEQSSWEIRGKSLASELSFVANMIVDETRWHISNLRVTVPRHVENELADLIDVVQERRCLKTFCSCFATYGELYRDRKSLFSRLKAAYASTVRIEIEPIIGDYTVAAQDLVDSASVLLIEPEGGKLFGRFEWQANFSCDDEERIDGYELQPIMDFTIDPQKPLQCKEDEEVVASSKDNFFRLVQTHGLEGAIVLVIRLIGVSTTNR